MSQVSSTRVLRFGFAIILGLLIYSAAVAFRLQRAGGELQAQAYRRYIEQEGAITALRRCIWLGGIYLRDYFLSQSLERRTLLATQLQELQDSGSDAIQTLTLLSPALIKDFQLESNFNRFMSQLGTTLSRAEVDARPPEITIDKEMALLEDFRQRVRQELVRAQSLYYEKREVEARTLLPLLGLAILLGASVAFLSLRYVARWERERQGHYEELAKANLELENLSARVLEIQEQERRALSRELHDEVGQILTALRMELSQATRDIVDTGPRERVDRARRLAERTVGMVRDISLMLRPALLDDLGLGPALQWQLEQFAFRSGIQSTFEGEDVGESLPDTVKTCVFRVAQEALNNCEKYASATNVQVVLQHLGDKLHMEVRDDGSGFDLDRRGLPARGTGIVGMKERVQKAGGVLAVTSQPGAGTVISLAIPIAQQLPS